MQILRRGGGAVLLALFQLLLFIFPAALALALLLQSPDAIKQTIRDGGIYDNLVPALLDQSVEQATQGGSTEAASLLQSQGLRDTIAKSLQGGQIESAAGQAIDGFYAWLQGKTPTPEFTIDLSPSKQAFIDNMNQYALDQAKSLPTCNLQQLRELQAQGGTTNIFDAPCLPPGISPETAASQFTQQAVNGSEFLANPVISSANLKDSSGKPVFASVDWLPQAYNWLMWSPWIIGGLILLCGVGVVLLHEERWRGIRRVAIALLVAGILLSIGSAAYWLFFANIDRVFTGVMTEVETAVSKIMSTSFGSYVQTVALTGGAYAVLGAAGLITSRFIKPKATVPAPESATNSSPAPVAQTTVSTTESTDTTSSTTETTPAKEENRNTPKIQ